MSCCKTLGLALLPPLTAANAAEAPPLAAEFGINRHALVTRHNVTITDFDTTQPRTRQTPLQIGNGHFAFGLDVTGLQTFMLHGSFSHATLSDWGWHSAANPEITLWDRTHLLDGWMEWMRGPGLESARRQAARQGCQGVRWMKMIAWTAEWESPSDAGPFRMMI